MIRIIKKDGTREDYNVQKVVAAVTKSANRALVTFTDEDYRKICTFVDSRVLQMGKDEIAIAEMHNIVEAALEAVNPTVAKSYRDYRNYKQDFVHMLDEVYRKSQAIMYIGDKENSNADSALVSTKRSLIFNQLNKELYQKFFLTVEELQACRDGYIYVHDMSARRDTMNCCLFDVAAVLEGGFEMGNLWYNEPKTLDVAFDVIGDIVLSAASQQYGGFTVPEADKILSKYAARSYDKYMEKYRALGLDEARCEEETIKDLENDFHQGFQGWEYKFNTVASSRGDYPFITVTFGLGRDRFAKMASKSMLAVADRARSGARSRCSSRSWSSSMTRTCTARAGSWRTSSRRAWTARSARCTPTGSRSRVTAMWRASTSATARSSRRWAAARSSRRGSSAGA
jgi:ribonucleoside-triphosphate reductase